MLRNQYTHWHYDGAETHGSLYLKMGGLLSCLWGPLQSIILRKAAFFAAFLLLGETIPQ